MGRAVVSTLKVFGGENAEIKIPFRIKLVFIHLHIKVCTLAVWQAFALPQVCLVIHCFIKFLNLVHVECDNTHRNALVAAAMSWDGIVPW